MINIKKLEDNITYKKEARDEVFQIGDKQVRVSSWFTDDPEFDNYENDYEINADDLKALTDEEHEAFGENLTELFDLKVGETYHVGE